MRGAGSHDQELPVAGQGILSEPSSSALSCRGLQVKLGRSLIRSHIEVAGGFEVPFGDREGSPVQIALVPDEGSALTPAGVESAPPTGHQEAKHPRPDAPMQVEQMSVVPQAELTRHRRDRIPGVQGQHLVEVRILGKKWSERRLGQRRDGRPRMPDTQGPEQGSDEQDVAD
jgi:hypothetical protein